MRIFADLLPDVFVLCRHAESENNVLKGGRAFLDAAATAHAPRVADQRVPITVTGGQQSYATGQGLCQEFEFDCVIGSGVLRTDQTIDGVARAYKERGVSFPQPIRLWQFLRERDVAYNFLMDAETSRQHFPWLQEHWDTHGPLLSRPPGGESMADVSIRAMLFLTNVLPALQAKKTFVVSHGGTIRCLRAIIEGWDIPTLEEALNRRNEVPNCGCIVYKKGALITQTYRTYY